MLCPVKPDQVANIEGVDVVLGAEQKGELMNYLGNLESILKVRRLRQLQKTYVVFHLRVLGVTALVIF